MTQTPEKYTHTESHWIWPVKLSTYDCTPSLTPVEYEALADRVQGADLYQHLDFVSIPLALSRLTQPLEDVLAYIDVLAEVRRDVLQFFHREMYFRHSSFWEWSHDDWIDLFRAQRSERVAHRVRHCYPHTILSIGYLLGDFTDFAAIGGVVRYPLACKIFGKVPVDIAIERIRSGLLSWGYSQKRMEEYLQRCMCAILLESHSPYFPRVAQRDTHLAEAALQNRSMLSLVLGRWQKYLCPLEIGEP